MRESKLVILLTYIGLIFTPLFLSADSDPYFETNPNNYDYSEIESEEIMDPFEPINRTVYKFNDLVDKGIAKPFAIAYNFLIPPWGRDRIGNALDNLNEPVTLVNEVLQGRPGDALDSFWRFSINTTIGLAGTFNVADHIGFSRKKEDFGQTLGYWGVGHGPYVVWPVIGPSSFRDSVGRTADYYSDPFNYMVDDEYIIARNSMFFIHKRAANLELTDDLDRVSLDPYAAVRSLYVQYRDKQVKTPAR